jgi:hypothetical protein
MLPRSFAGWTAVLAALLLPSLVRANIGPRWWGDRTAEPLGLKGVAITSESLTLDLRPLLFGQPVEVEAIYHFHNTGPAKKLDLLFLTGGIGVSDFEVRLDNRRVESKSLPAEERSEKLPASWEPPEYLPGFESDHTPGRTHLAPSEKIVLTFALELPPGSSKLQARYRARAVGTDEGYPTVTWQFPYILAPAREWGSFGSLVVTVHVPEGWQATSTPTLERNGDVLRREFTSVPADCLAVAVRKPVGPELRQAIIRYVILYALILIAGGVACWWMGRRFCALLLSRDKLVPLPLFSKWITPFALIMPFLWSAAICLVHFLAYRATHATLVGQESPYFGEYFYLPNCGTLVLLLLVIPVGYVLHTRGVFAYKRAFEDAAYKYTEAQRGTAP